MQHISSSQMKTPKALSRFFSPPSPLPQATTNQLSISMNSSSLTISRKCNHTRCDFLCLASFTHHHVFEVHPCGSMSVLHSCLMTDSYPVVCINHTWLLHSFIDGHLDCSQLLTLVSDAAVNIHGQVICMTFCFQFYRGIYLALKLLSCRVMLKLHIKLPGEPFWTLWVRLGWWLDKQLALRGCRVVGVDISPSLSIWIL